MNEKELEALRSLVRILIDHSTYFTQGAITAQLIVVRAMLESKAIDKALLSEEVSEALAALTDEQKGTAFPNALIQLAQLLGANPTATQKSSAEALLEALHEIDPKKMH